MSAHRAVAAAQQVLQEAADLLADADPRLAVELLPRSVYWTVEAGLFDVASRVTGRITDLAERSDDRPGSWLTTQLGVPGVAAG